MKSQDLTLQNALDLLRSDIVQAKIELAQAKSRSSRTSKESRVGGLTHALKIMERIIS